MILIIKKARGFAQLFRVVAITVIVILTSFADTAFASTTASTTQKMFAAPQEAITAFIAAARNNDTKAFTTIFGSEAKQLFSSGDPVNDKLGRERFLKAYDEKNSLVADGENMVLVVGKEEWPFPIPLVKKGEAWFFDTLQGKDEILNRRIGRNELETIQTCLAIVDAQREYAMQRHNEKGSPVYAAKFISDPGKKNGLYWETKEGEVQSPLGPEIAKAKAAGYGRDQAREKSIPFHGYYYRILGAQGKNAVGGAYSYIVKGKMIGGFAVVAFPAQYENSGVMTFIVNHDGVVYQKDLGKNTVTIAKSMQTFDPGQSWKKVDDSGKGK